MAGSIKRVYWDACTWIALIHKEKIRDSKGIITEDRETMCRTILHQAETKPQLIEIATSALSLVEVCKHPKSKSSKTSDIASYFEHDYVLLVNLDRFSGEKSRDLMMVGYSGLKPPDAVHLAAAIVANVEEMHTFDRDLLKHDGMIDKPDGTKLKIVKPDTSSPAPLLEEAAKPAPTVADLSPEAKAPIPDLPPPGIEANPSGPFRANPTVPLAAAVVPRSTSSGVPAPDITAPEIDGVKTGEADKNGA
jgi:predicted nucleic acid-binding protein